jgi:DNA-binding NarL/FixJ family response regulator
MHGFSTEEISAALCVSLNTVQDHLKKIFDKVGVHSRRELVARVFTSHYEPHIRSGHGLGANGWFKGY